MASCATSLLAALLPVENAEGADMDADEQALSRRYISHHMWLLLTDLSASLTHGVVTTALRLALMPWLARYTVS